MEKRRFYTNGNIGIGSAQPTAKLDVSNAGVDLNVLVFLHSKMTLDSLVLVLVDWATLDMIKVLVNLNLVELVPIK